MTFQWANRGLMAGVAEAAVTLVAEKVTADTKKAAPRMTGRLAESYRYRLVQRGSRGRATAVVETDVFYAIFSEFGTSAAAAQPHLGPSVEVARRLYG